jgi:hypothetical protein
MDSKFRLARVRIRAGDRKKLVGDAMKYFVVTLCGKSRPYLRFTIFALLTLVVALSVAGCIGATGATKPIPTITTEALFPGIVNELYSARLTAQGGVQPYHWGIPSGKLPARIELAPSTGEIEGTPAAAGTSSFVVKVTDSSAAPKVSWQTLTLTIAETEPAFTISTISLPEGNVRASYRATLHAEGGTAPYSWSVSSGTIPTGLTLNANGVISGTPTKSSPRSTSGMVAHR